MSIQPSDTIFTALDSVLNPKPTSGKSIFAFAIAVLVASGTLFIISASSPLLSDWWGCKIVEFIGSSQIEPIKHWCDWLAVLLQILLVIAIGGVVFTDTHSQYCRTLSDKLGEFMLKSAVKDAEQRTKFLDDFKNEAIDTAKEPINFRKMIKFLFTTYKFLRNTTNLPNHYIWFALRGFLLNFPGRIYGFAAFVILALQTLATTTKIALDYTATSSCLLKTSALFSYYFVC